MHLLNNVIVLLILSAGAVISARLKKLTPPAAFTGGLTGYLVFAGAGYPGLGLLAAFFVMGTLASSHSTTRTTGQVLANGGIAALAGLGIVLLPSHRLLLEWVMAGSLASATADTLSSELGMVYGRRFYNILTFRPDTKGLDGVVSIEGTLIGIGGATAIALLYAITHGLNAGAWLIIIAGAVGNLTDSILGATLERKGLIGNNMVNFLNTLTGGLIAGLLADLTRTL